MGTATEITNLAKFSLKREHLLRTIKENVEIKDEYLIKETVSSSKLYIIHWAVQATAF